MAEARMMNAHELSTPAAIRILDASGRAASAHHHNKRELAQAHTIATLPILV